MSTRTEVTIEPARTTALRRLGDLDPGTFFCDSYGDVCICVDQQGQDVTSYALLSAVVTHYHADEPVTTVYKTVRIFLGEAEKK